MTKISRPALRRTFVSAAVSSALLGSSAFAGTVSGRVTDATGVRPLNGAQVRIQQLGRTATAGADGLYRFQDVTPGSYTLRVTYVGAEPQELTIDVLSDGGMRVDVGLRARAEDNILVVGQRANLSSSLSRQRASDTIETVLTRDAVGQFPDQNVAEALRRVPGINVLNDQGEGRFVSERREGRGPMQGLGRLFRGDGRQTADRAGQGNLGASSG